MVLFVGGQRVERLSSLQRKQDGEGALLGATLCSIERLHRTTSCRLKHTHRSLYPDIYLVSGFPFGASLGALRGNVLPPAVLDSRLRRGKSSSGIISWGAGDGEGTSATRGSKTVGKLS